jgi:glyoxylase-like metal-dependent hydrolase (beta-lactamase superfamily II)
MRLTEHVYLVGGGLLGCGLSDDFDCHVSLIDGGAEMALVDAGAGMTIEPILRNIEFDGLDPARLRNILLTHAHADHAGGCRAWKDRLGLDVAASKEAGQYLRDGDEEKVSLAIARRGGYYPADYVYRACPVAHALCEGDRFQVGSLTVRAFETPGHCSGMLSYLLDDAGKQVLFTGDTVFHDGKVLISNLWDCDLRQYVTSVEKLAQVPADAMLPGHLAISLSDGGRHIRKAYSIMQNLSFPASII